MLLFIGVIVYNVTGNFGDFDETILGKHVIVINDKNKNGEIKYRTLNGTKGIIIYGRVYPSGKLNIVMDVYHFVNCNGIPTDGLKTQKDRYLELEFDDVKIIDTLSS